MDSRILYIENPNDAIKRLLEIINMVKFQDAKSAHSLTHGIVAHQVLLHLRLVPTVHGFQGAEQGPPP